MWVFYILLLVAAALVYGTTMARKRMQQAPPHQRQLGYITIVGEFAAVVAALTTAFLILSVDKQQMHFGKVGPLRMRTTKDPQLQAIRQVEQVISGDPSAAQKALFELTKHPQSLACRFAQQAYNALNP